MSDDSEERTGSGCAAKLGMVILLAVLLAVLYFLVIQPQLSKRGIALPGLSGKVMDKSSGLQKKSDVGGEAAVPDAQEVTSDGGSAAEIIDVPPVQPEGSNEKSDPNVDSWY